MRSALEMRHGWHISHYKSELPTDGVTRQTLFKFALRRKLRALCHTTTIFVPSPARVILDESGQFYDKNSPSHGHTGILNWLW